MLLEQLLFVVISFAIFVFIFLKMITKNDTSYVTILVCEAIGIAIDFVEVLFNACGGIFFVILKYILAIAIPILVIVLEKNGTYLFEFINLTMAKIYLLLSNSKNAKKELMELLDKNPRKL